MEKFHTSNLTAHLKALEGKEAKTPKRSRREEISPELKSINKKQREQNKKNQFLKLIFLRKLTNRKPLSNLTKGQRENIQMNKIRKESGHITDTKEVQVISRSYFGSLHSTKL